METRTPLIEFKNVCKWYGEDENKTYVLKNINLKIYEGEFLSIVGFTGSGKTTLVNLMTGLLFPNKGKVLYKGSLITGTSLERGIIFQNYSLLPWMNVYENVQLGVEAMYSDWSKEKKDKQIRDFIEMVNLTPAIDKKTKELSGGMRQRVSVARVLSTDPELLLMDEPLGALDALTRGNLQDEILKIWSKNKRTALLITNDVDEGLYMADRVIPLEPGPEATLGPEFKIKVERPRVKKELNVNEDFIRTRNEILKYLESLSRANKQGSTNKYELPDLKPLSPNSRVFPFSRSAS